MSAIQELIDAIEGIQDWGGTHVGDCIAAVEAEQFADTSDLRSRLADAQARAERAEADVVKHRIMLEVARCPNCDGSGVYVQANPRTGEPGRAQCEWCYYRQEILITPAPQGRTDGERLRIKLDLPDFTTIYVASKTKHAPMWQRFRDAGHPIISTWIDEAGAGESPDLPDLALRCIREAAEASFTVLYCEPGETLKGALMEAGAALAACRDVRCVGTCENLSPVLALHPQWKRYDSVEAALSCRESDATAPEVKGGGE